MRNQARPEVVYVERGGDSSAKWLFWGALVGAGLALLYAPRSGEETRRNLQRKLWKLRAMTEEKFDELSQQFADKRLDPAADADEDEEDDALGVPEPGVAARAASGGARQELERRLADARSRRRTGTSGDVDVPEPLA